MNGTGGQPGTGTGGKGGTSGGSSPDGGGTLDGAAGAPADVVVVDSSVAKSIACGTATCNPTGQVCCLTSPPHCETAMNACPPGTDRLACDDRSDCPLAGQVCCLVEYGGGLVRASCQMDCAIGQRNIQMLCDPAQKGSCLGAGSDNQQCTTEGSILDGYPHCH